MRKIIYIGVDPGLSGGIGILYPEGDAVGISMPTASITRGGKTNKGNKRKKTEYEPQGLLGILQPFADAHHDPECEYVVSVALEGLAANAARSKGRKQDTPVTAFSLGRATGVIEGMLWALRLPYSQVMPAQWRPAMVGAGTDKEAARLRAQKLFPGAELHQKNHEGRAEALLIAEFFRRKQEGRELPIFKRVRKTKKVRVKRKKP